MINLIKYIVLGIIQGLTEPLPISSSGHLLLFREIFNTNMFNDLNFEIFVNFGSFVAIFIIFYKDIINIFKDFFSYILNKKNRKESFINYKYAWLIVIGSIPVGIAGLLLKDYLENLLSNVKVLGIAFIITALAIFLVRKIKGEKTDKDITIRDAIIIGLMQVIALCPGISRSGTVLVACLLCNIKRENALKYTFMLYFPVSIASFLLGVIDIIKEPTIGSIIIPYICGMIMAGIVTFFTYKWLSNLVKKGKLWYFSIYCVILSIFIFIYFR